MVVVKNAYQIWLLTFEGVTGSGVLINKFLGKKHEIFWKIFWEIAFIAFWKINISVIIKEATIFDLSESKDPLTSEELLLRVIIFRFSAQNTFIHSWNLKIVGSAWFLYPSLARPEIAGCEVKYRKTLQTASWLFPLTSKNSLKKLRNERQRRNFCFKKNSLSLKQQISSTWQVVL